MHDYKVYYGEYTLKHWISLLLRKEVVLPEYQRNFVWDEAHVTGLINSLQNRSFVPPVVIGAFFERGIWKNYILDGQQRLTAILLAFLNRFPKRSSFPKTEKIGNDTDDEEDTDENSLLEWNFKQITDKGCLEKDEIISTLETDLYKSIDIKNGINISALADDFFTNTYLGFSFIKPSSNDVAIQTKYYAELFRSINTTAWSLNHLESRRSLYWLKGELVSFFDPQCIHTLKLPSNARLDFVRYLALLSEYHKLKPSERSHLHLAKGFSGREPNPPIESYIENYIYHIIGEKDSEKFSSLKDIFNDSSYQNRLKVFENILKEINIPKQFSSIIDADIYLFGLIFYIIFESQIIDLERKSDIVKKLQMKIEEFRKDTQHSKRPAALKYLNKRIEESLKIYSEYIKTI